MQKILRFKKSFKYYYNLIEKRRQKNDLWGVLDAIKNAQVLSKNKSQKQKLKLLKAQTYYEMGQFDQSLNLFFSIAQNKVFRASAFFGIGRNLACKRNYNLALSYFEAVLKWDVLNVFHDGVLEWTQYIKDELDAKDSQNEVLIVSAKKFMAEKKFKEAKKILGGMKTELKTLELIALCELCLGDNSVAKQKAKEALSEKENSAIALMVLIKATKNCGGNSDFYKQQLLSLQIDCPVELKKVGLFLSQEQDFLSALIYFEKLCEREEYSATNHLFLGLCYFNLKQTEKSLFEINKAIWLEEDNPIYEFFYEAIKTNEFDVCQIKKKLPPRLEKEKIEGLLEVFFSGSFSKEFKKSHNLKKDIVWSFGINNESLTTTVTESLVASKNKDAICLLKDLMLSTSPTQKQKFLILKEAIKNELFLDYNLVCKNVYSSFRLKKHELSFLSKNLLEGAAIAISYAECYFPQKMLLEKIVKNAFKQSKNSLTKNLSSKFLACFLLKDFDDVLFCACSFFGVEQKALNDFAFCQNGEGKSYD